MADFELNFMHINQLVTFSFDPYCTFMRYLD
jgi:hypothetical protein